MKIQDVQKALGKLREILESVGAKELTIVDHLDLYDKSGFGRDPRISEIDLVFNFPASKEEDFIKYMLKKSTSQDDRYAGHRRQISISEHPYLNEGGKLERKIGISFCINNLPDKEGWLREMKETITDVKKIIDNFYD